MKRLLLLCGYVLFVSVSNGQKPPLKYGKISRDEIDITTRDYFSDAVVLYDYGRFYFDLNNAGNRLFAYYDRHIRIKILTEEGIERAKQEFLYYNLRNALYYEGEVITLKAQTFNPKNNGELDRQRVKKRNIRYTDKENHFTKVEFTFPDVKPGSIIEYTYRLATLEMINPRDWYFQHDIPVRWSEFRAEIPRNFIYQLASQNMKRLDINEQDSYTQALNWTFDTRKEYFRGGVPLPGYGRRIYKGTFSVNGNSYRFVRKNVPALEEGPYTDNIKNYYEKIKLKLVRGDKSVQWGFLAQDLFKSVVQGYELRDKGEKEIMMIPAGYVFYEEPEINKVIKELNRSTKFGLPLILHLQTGDSVTNKINTLDTEKEKMVYLYNLVRDRMNWNGQYSIFLDEGLPKELINIVQRTADFFSRDNNRKYVNISLKKPFDNKTGTSSEINMILINLLKKNGLNASPVLISTVDNGVIDTSFFNLRRFNHVIAHVETENGNYLLDAIDKNRPYYILNENDLNSPGLLIMKNDYEWIGIGNNYKSKHLINGNLTLTMDGSLQGEINHILYGQFDTDFRETITDTPVRITNEIYKYASKKPIVLSDNHTETNNAPYPLTLSHGVKFYDMIKSVNDSLHFDLFSLVSNQYNPFEQSIREYPVDFGFPREYSCIMNIQFPESFNVLSLPAKTNLTLANKGAYYHFKHELNGNNLQFVSTLTILKNRFNTAEYYELFKLLHLMEKKFKEFAVFTVSQ